MTCDQYREVANRPLTALASNTELTAAGRHLAACCDCQEFTRSVVLSDLAGAEMRRHADHDPEA